MSGRCKKCNKSYWEHDEKEIYIFSYFKQNIELINEKYRPVEGVYNIPKARSPQTELETIN